MRFIQKIPSKYKRMVAFSSVMVAALFFMKCIEYSYSFVDFLYIVPAGAVMGLVVGIVVAFLSWGGVKLGLWTMPDI